MNRQLSAAVVAFAGCVIAAVLIIPASAKGQEKLPQAPDLINSISMKFRQIPAGKFLMGSPLEHLPNHANAAEEGPQHEVEISKPFYCGIYEVTQREYLRVTATNPSFHQSDNPVAYDPEHKPKTTDNLPVEWLTWHDAVMFCRKMSELPEEKMAGRVYRLPTEAEWEYACRAGTTTRFSFGNECNGSECCCDGRVPVGSGPKGNRVDNPRPVGS
jgi:formylglycine-generating enzyme required for sulfatase activity